MARGQLRIYLGAAPGVGKTYAMLEEAQRRRDRGTDVVVGLVETHGRRRTADMVDGLEVVPRQQLEYRGAAFTELDVDAVLARAPQVAVVDELAHTNVPGSRNAKRWQDVHELLAAGITVLSTVNIQHLESLNDVVEQITGVVQRETVPDGAWRVAASVGGDACAAPAEGDSAVAVDEQITLVLRGPALPAADRRIVEAFAAQAAVALRQERLAAEAARARPLAEADKLRTALLAAVSHDLRTPLASAVAAVAGLRSEDVTFSAEDRRELLATAAESLDRLTRLVSNLLDMSRLQAGALGVATADVWLDEAVPTALDELGAAGRAVRVRIPEDLSAARADPGLLQRVLVNVVSNALRFSPPDRPPLSTASEHGELVELRVVDHGPGIPEEQRDQVFLPFQRLGDRDNDTGVGLGLALSRGLTEAMGGTLAPETTPGGGLTMVLNLPAVPNPPGLTAAEAAAAERAFTESRHRPAADPETAT